MRILAALAIVLVLPAGFLLQPPARAEKPVKLWTVTTEYPVYAEPVELTVAADAQAMRADGWICSSGDHRVSEVNYFFKRPGAARKGMAWLKKHRGSAGVLEDPPGSKKRTLRSRRL